VGTFVWLRRLTVPSLAAMLLGCGIAKPPDAIEVDASAALDAGAVVDTATDAAEDAQVDTEVDAEVVTCLPPRSTVCVSPAPSFAADVVPILDARCNGCHDPALPAGPWPLHDYQDVVDWRGVVVESLLNCTMPPPEAGPPLPEDERQRLFAWVACGTPDN
jgi:hypothetical protein